MSRPAIAFVLALAATTANAQDTKSEQPQTPAVASGNGLRPFLFDGRPPVEAALDLHHNPAFACRPGPPRLRHS